MTESLPKNNTRLLSIISITRNEVSNVCRCIESALQAIKEIPGSEITLVDSASNDDTVELARQYPIQIIQLKPDWPLTPGAGRYIGTLHTTGQHVLFLDGDMEVSSDWVKEALTFLQTNPSAAAVGGRLDEIYLDPQGNPTGNISHRYRAEELKKVKTLGGGGMYQRKALDEVGTFNPYLALYEEAELSLRLRKAKYSIWCLPMQMTQHFSAVLNLLGMG